MKSHLLLIFLVSILCSCEKNHEDVIIEDNSPKYDSLIYKVHLITDDENIYQMEKFLNDELVELIELIYEDTFVEKKHYASDTLIEKNIYYFEGNKYASFSIDSIFEEDKYFQTYYTYDDQGYLKEEKHIPGVFSFSNDSSAYTIFEYSHSNGNLHKTLFLLEPPNVISTGVFDYKYSDLESKFDITSYKNAILGMPNKNLPSAYGWQEWVRPGHFYEDIKYDYELNEGLVTRRIDSYLDADTISYKHILIYTYN